MSGNLTASDRLPRLEYLGRGTQSRVFGTGCVAVKVPRWSPLALLALFLRRERWLPQVERELGGLVLPFRSVGGIRFVAPAGPGVSAPVREFRPGRALLLPLLPPDAWLDTRFYAARPDEAERLIGRMLDLLEELRERGFCMIDFIMSNFVEFDGRLVVADPGLLVPARLAAWHPTFAISAWQFRHWLGRDYDRLLAGKASEAAPHEARRLHAFRAECRRRIAGLGPRARPAKRVPPRRQPLAFPPFVEQAARRILLV